MLNENTAKMYPIYAKQYVNDIWEEKVAKIYQVGKWVDLLQELYLYKDGEIYETITGGWSTDYFDVPGGGPLGPVVNSDGKLTFTYTAGVNSAGGGTRNTIDISEFKSLRVIGAKTTNSTTTMFVGIYSNRGLGDAAASVTIPNQQGNFDVSLDISNFTGLYRIGIFLAGYVTKVALAR